MTAAERRELIMATLRRQHKAKISNLAAAFDCSERTILRDIEILSKSFPLITKHGRYGGGVEMAETNGFKSKALSPEQILALRTAMKVVDPQTRLALSTVLDDFSPRRG